MRAWLALRRAWDERASPPLLPRARASAWLCTALAGALASVALLCLIAAERTARDWRDGFAREATLAVSGDEAAWLAARLVLETTAGVEAVELLERDPWLARVRLAPDGGPDPELLDLRLQAEAPGALYDDHAAWKEPLLAASTQLRRLGWTLGGGAAAAAVALAAMATHAASAPMRAAAEALLPLGVEARALRRRLARSGVVQGGLAGGAGASAAAAAGWATAPTLGGAPLAQTPDAALATAVAAIGLAGALAAAGWAAGPRDPLQARRS